MAEVIHQTTIDIFHNQSHFTNTTLFQQELTHEIDDVGYYMIVYLTLCVIVGIPLNLWSFRTLVRKRGANRTTLLKINLNISDILVLIFLALVRMIYEAVHYWYGGGLLCKLFKFGQALGLSLSSTVIVCISLDRLLYLVKPFTPQPKAWRRTRALIILAWVYALFFSAPQLVAFQLYDRPEDPRSPQCVFWYFAKASDPDVNLTSLDDALFILHNYSHMVTAFWLPMVVMTLSYAGILWCMWRKFLTTTDTESPAGSTVITDLGAVQNESQQENENIHLEHICPVQGLFGAPCNGRWSVPSVSRSKRTRSKEDSSKHQSSCTDVDCDSMPELVESSCTHENDVIQLLPCLVDYREPSENQEVTPLQESLQAGQVAATLTSTKHTSRHHSPVGGGLFQSPRFRRIPVKTAKTTMLLLNAYLFCWFPLNLNIFWGLIDQESWLASYRLHRFSVLLVVFNSVLNPMIYGISFREVKERILAKGMLTTWCRLKTYGHRVFCCPKTPPADSTPKSEPAQKENAVMVVVSEVIT